MTITTEILEEFKERMHLGDYEDKNLMRILSACNQALLVSCGNYDINMDEEFKELVLERSRYVYNDALEYFDINFLSRINALGTRQALKEIQSEGDTNATL